MLVITDGIPNCGPTRDRGITQWRKKLSPGRFLPTGLMHGEDCVVPSNIHGGARCGTDWARLVGIVADRHEIDGELVGLQDHSRASDRELADTTSAEASADDDAFGTAPSF
jgi:hypothetical protein